MLTLHKTGQHFTTRLQQRVAYHNLQEALQSLPPVLNDIVAESIRKNFAWQWRYGDSSALALQYVSEVFEIGISPTDRAMFELESGNICTADDFIVRVHVA